MAGGGWWFAGILRTKENGLLSAANYLSFAWVNGKNGLDVRVHSARIDCGRSTAD